MLEKSESGTLKISTLVRHLLKFIPILIVLLFTCSYDSIMNHRSLIISYTQLKTAFIVGGISSFFIIIKLKRFGITVMVWYIISMLAMVLGRYLDSFAAHPTNVTSMDLGILCFIFSLFIGVMLEALKK